MAMNKLNIPKTITVGFQEREDTYTKKLAYVIYTDAKGVLRKETSWQSWRNKKIDSEQYDNEPTAGFVLNKKVGGNNYSWNPRNTYVRVFDPRGFEFEISIPNLLFILQETSSIKGKGLEGEFVYAWDGTELVLLPTTCQEYVQSSDFTGLQTKKVTAKEIKEGFIYVNKDNDRVMYLGRHKWSERKYGKNPVTGKYEYHVSTDTKHIFVQLGEKKTSDSYKYWVQSGFTKLATVESTECSVDFAEEYDALKKSCPNIGDDFAVKSITYSVLDKIEGLHQHSSYHFVTPNGVSAYMRRKISEPESTDILIVPDHNCSCALVYEDGNLQYGIMLTGREYYSRPPLTLTKEQAATIMGEKKSCVNVANEQELYTIQY